MMESGSAQLDKLMGGGYPTPGAILVVGPPNIEKEVLGLQFILKGLEKGEVCFILATTRTKSDIADVIKLLNRKNEVPGELYFMDASGSSKDAGTIKFDMARLDEVYSVLKEFLDNNSGSVVRGYIELLSPALMVNPQDKIYEFAVGLHKLVHQHKATFLFSVESGMHEERAMNALKQVYDGVIGIELERKGTNIRDLINIEKMGGNILPKKYYEFSAIVPESTIIFK